MKEVMSAKQFRSATGHNQTITCPIQISAIAFENRKGEQHESKKFEWNVSKQMQMWGLADALGEIQQSNRKSMRSNYLL